MMALKFIAVFGAMGIPIFISLATCNEVRSPCLSIAYLPYMVNRDVFLLRQSR